MTSDRWPQIELLFRETLKHRPEKRSAFLAQACEGDAPLQEEVQRLLEHHDQAESQAFLELPAPPLPWLRLNPLGPQVSSTIEADTARDNASLGEHPLLEAGARIGRYRIKALLGDGGFGRVYRADDEMLQRTVAIKVPNRQRISKAEDVEAYLAEARVLASLDHPNIVPVHDVGRTEDGLCYVVSKFIEGSDLRKRIDKQRPSYQQTAEWIATVAQALHYAHKKGLVHRDIKPGNLLLDSAGKLYVADFGLALKEQEFGQGASWAGTPAYMSPEQARGEGHRVDGRSDIFSLGVVLYELLTGKRPFQGESLGGLLEQIKTVEARPPRQREDSIPKELERICLKALSKRATARYTTALDMAEHLKHWQTGSQHDSASDRRPTYDSRLPTPPIPKIIPKGLRSLDADDADFFLEEVPGPGDQDGLSERLKKTSSAAKPSAKGHPPSDDRQNSRQAELESGFRLGRLGCNVRVAVTIVMLLFWASHLYYMWPSHVPLAFP